MDIGTNCEIVLGNDQWLLATAAPAGPAFEGASIRCGMRASAGAIEVVAMTMDALDLRSSGTTNPPAFAGPGWLTPSVSWFAAVCWMALVVCVDETALEVAPAIADRLTKIGEEPVFILAEKSETDGDPVYLSQRDVRELQFAKAAISTGWQLLIEAFGVQPEDIQQVLLAGSFGTYLSAASAVRIGLVPKLPVLRIISAGNVAGEGAKMVLLSAQERHGAQTLLNEIEYLELSDRTDFNDRFVDELAFPPLRWLA